MKRATLADAWARSFESRRRANALIAKAREAHIDDFAQMAESIERNR